VNQSKLLHAGDANHEKMSASVTVIGFGFTPDWMKKSVASFF